MGNIKKNEQLGMPFGTASAKLRKSILFNLLKETNKNVCYQCGKPIELEEELSIEHKVPWLDSDKPKDRFFDIKNIAFSHLSCNISCSSQCPRAGYQRRRWLTRTPHTDSHRSPYNQTRDRTPRQPYNRLLRRS